MGMTTTHSQTACLDIITWTYDPHQSPAGVDAAHDRAARRWFLAHWILQWAGAVFIVVVVLPSALNIMPTLDPTLLIVGTVLVVVGVIGTRHALVAARRRSGVPVVPDLQPLIAPMAKFFAHAHQVSHTVEDQSRTHHSRRGRARLRQNLYGFRRTENRVRSRITARCELAAYLHDGNSRLARWLHDRQVRILWRFCVRLGTAPDIAPSQVASAGGLSAIEDEILDQQLRALIPTRSAVRIPTFFPPNIHQATVTVEQPAEQALVMIRDALQQHGHLHGRDDDALQVRAVIGGGTWAMNPAVVTVTAERIADGQTRLIIRGVAREGIVKQRAGQQVVNRIIATLPSQQM